jgi:hypothetical protein
MTEQQKPRCVYLIWGCRSEARYALESGEPVCQEHFTSWLKCHGDEVTFESGDDGLQRVVT